MKTWQPPLLMAVVAIGALTGGVWLRAEMAPSNRDKAAADAVAQIHTASDERVQRPDFQFADQDGVVRRIADWDGQVLVVNFWATWCAPCIEEIPFFVELQRSYAGDGVQFLGIAVDDMENVQAFAEQYALNYPTAAGDESAFEMLKAFGNTFGGLPYTALVDRDGDIVFRHPGAIERSQLEAAIQAFLKPVAG